MLAYGIFFGYRHTPIANADSYLQETQSILPYTKYLVCRRFQGLVQIRTDKLMHTKKQWTQRRLSLRLPPKKNGYRVAVIYSGIRSIYDKVSFVQQFLGYTNIMKIRLKNYSLLHFSRYQKKNCYF
jgi:precorrin-3B methylase